MIAPVRHRLIRMLLTTDEKGSLIDGASHLTVQKARFMKAGGESNLNEAVKIQNSINLILLITDDC